MGRGLKKAVIFDIDGTLSDCEHRRHLVDLKRYDIKDAKSDWPEFFRRADQDQVIEPIRTLLLQLRPFNHIVLCTGRDEGQRALTVRWLAEKAVPYSALFMRTRGDYRPDHVIKLELLDKIREFYKPWLVVDDRNSVVAMWRKAGLTCLQCAEGDF